MTTMMMMRMRSPRAKERRRRRLRRRLRKSQLPPKPRARRNEPLIEQPLEILNFKQILSYVLPTTINITIIPHTFLPHPTENLLES